MKHKITYTLLAATFLSLTCATHVIAGAGGTAGRGVSGTKATTSAASSASKTSTISSIGRGLEDISKTASTVQSGAEAASSISGTNSLSGVGTAASSADKVAGSVDSLLGTKTAGSISNTTSTVSKAAGDLSDIGNAAGSIAGANSLSGVGTAASGADAIAKTVDKWTGGNIAGNIGNTTKKTAEVAGDLSGAMDTVSNIAKGDLSFDTASDITSGADSLSKTFDKWAGTSTSGDIGKLTGDANKVIGSAKDAFGAVQDVQSTINSMVNQVEGVVDLIKDPEALMQMALGMVPWDQIEQIVMNVAENLILDLFATPSVGIPVKEPVVAAQKGLEEVQKKLTSEIQTDIDKEKEKQSDAMGATPAQPAAEQTGTQQPPADETSGEDSNPSPDNCPATMAQYKPITNLAFDFINENMLKEVKNEKIGKKQEGYEQAVEYIKSTFYHGDAATLTPEIEKALTKKRQDYLQDVNSNVLSVSIGVQQALAEDAKSISLAPTSGCGFIDDVNINTQTMIALSKQTMAEIAMQIRLFELEAIKEQTRQPIDIIPKPGEEINQFAEDLKSWTGVDLNAGKDALPDTAQTTPPAGGTAATGDTAGTTPAAGSGSTAATGSK